ncbi:MAG: PHP domain-containing protein [Bacillota bacterium]|jgi:hypothetical protein
MENMNNSKSFRSYAEAPSETVINESPTKSRNAGISEPHEEVHERKVLIDAQNATWYKGNLHAHSTLSDGKLTPSEVVEMYIDRGYSFLAFSEHQRYTFHSDLQQPGFIILPAIERNKSFGDPRRYFHINGILGPKHLRKGAKKAQFKHMERVPMPDLDEYSSTAQEIIDELRDSGHLVMFNHPQWSFSDFDDLLSIDGYFAVEIFNYTSEMETGNGTSTIYWDAVLRAGRKVWGIASDDNHNGNRYNEAQPEWDSFGGWVMVNAPELSHDAITAALIDGNFYSSSGPEIYHLSLEGNRIHVECSPVQRIYFMTYFRHGYSRCNSDGSSIQSADYELRGNEKYVRVECVDERGKIAWSNPIFL